MSFLTRPLIGGIPTWVVIIVVGVGGVLIYFWFKNRSSTNAANSAQSASGLPGANQNINPLNPYNDPNIDPNTGVPYAIEEGINPNTGLPNYYNSQGTPSSSSNPNPSLPTAPVPSPSPLPTPIPGLTRNPDIGFIYHNPPTQIPVDQPIPPPPVPVTSSYVFQPVGNTRQTAPVSHVAQQVYGTTGTQTNMAATQAIINANPSLRGKPGNYQPPVGTRIVLPQL